MNRDHSTDIGIGSQDHTQLSSRKHSAAGNTVSFRVRFRVGNRVRVRVRVKIRVTDRVRDMVGSGFDYFSLYGAQLPAASITSGC